MMIKCFAVVIALTYIFSIPNLVDTQPLSLCPPGWNETDYRCYYLLSTQSMSFNDADNECGKLGMGARIAYPADTYELNLLRDIAGGSTIWVGYMADGKTYKTFYNAVGFPNQFEDPAQSSATDTSEDAATTVGYCGIYTLSDDGVNYKLSSQSCSASKAYTVCQMSYCSPLSTDLKPPLLWMEYQMRCYFFNASAATFSDARSFCAAYSAVLAVPDSQEENDFMMRIFGNNDADNKQRWIGVKSDPDSTGSVVSWIDPADNTAPSFTFWKSSALAASAASGNDSCVYMEGISGNGWGFRSCSDQLPFICRRVVGSLSYINCTKGVYGKYTPWTADCALQPGSQTRRWRKCISGCSPPGCLQITAKYCQYQAKWATWGPWGECLKPTKGSFQMASTPCIFNGQRTRSRQCKCGTETCGGCGSSTDSTGGIQSANCNIYISRLCPTQDCTYCSSQFTHTHCYEDGSTDSLTNNFRCVCDLGYNREPTDVIEPRNTYVPMGCKLDETNDDSATECSCPDALSYNECLTDYSSCTNEQLCQYPSGGPHTCYCMPGFRKIPSGGCVAASRIPPQCKIVSGSTFNVDSRGDPLIPYERGYICTCGQTEVLIQAGYSTRNSTTGEEAAVRIVSRSGKYMCYCLRATISTILRTDPTTNLPVETKFNLTRQFVQNFPECESTSGNADNMTFPKIPADLFTDVNTKLAELQKKSFFQCTGADGFSQRFEYLAQPVLGEALSPPLEEPASEYAAFTRLLSVDEAAVDLFQSLSATCETQRAALTYFDVMSGTQVFIGNMSSKDTSPTFVQMLCGNWSFPPEAVDRSQYPGVYQPLIAHCYLNASYFKSSIYNSTAAKAEATSLSTYMKNALKEQELLSYTYSTDYDLPKPLINSGIMSISTNPDITKMPEGVYLNIWFPLNQPPAGDYQPMCTFYDFDYVTGPTWQTKESGCNTTYFNSSNGIGYVQCQCTHMTIFAVTMVVVTPSSYYLAAAMLNAIVVGGSALSIVCLALTLLIYIQLRRFSTERIGIMILCFSIGMTQALLLAGAKLTVSPSTCRIISICLHFFGLLTFSLVASLSLAMYFRFIAKFRKGWQNVALYYGLGFAIPTVTVVVTAGGFFDSYGVGYSCWMDMDGLIKWAFFVPFMIIGILGLFLLIKVAPVLYKVKGHKSKTFSQAEVYGAEFKYGVQQRERIEVIFDVSKKKFWSLIILLVILTSTWVLGIFSMQFDSVYFDYGFAIFNASQGFFIFIMFCIREEEVRILCCAGCLTKQQPAGKISWTKFVDIYERYFALVLHSEEQERKLTFNEFVSQEYQTGVVRQDEIVPMGSYEYVSAQRGLAKPNYLLTCSCCFPVRTGPMPMSMQMPMGGMDGMPPPPPQADLTQKLFVVGPDGQLMCLDKNGDNAVEILEEIERERPGSVSVATGSAGPTRQPSTRSQRPVFSAKPGESKPPVAENWVPPPSLFPEFPDSDEEGEVAADIAAEVKINRDMMPKAEPAPPPLREPSAIRLQSARLPSAQPPAVGRQANEAIVEDIDNLPDNPDLDEGNNDAAEWLSYARPVSTVSSRIASSRAASSFFRPPSGISAIDETNITIDAGDDVNRPTSTKPVLEPTSARRKKLTRATDELDPMNLDG